MDLPNNFRKSIQDLQLSKLSTLKKKLSRIFNKIGERKVLETGKTDKISDYSIEYCYSEKMLLEKKLKRILRTKKI